MNKNSIKVLHVVKTTDGAQWALEQVKHLVVAGFEVHVALNSTSGKFLKKWNETGATLHFIDLSLSLGKPFSFVQRLLIARKFVLSLNPNIIHCHFFTNIIFLRIALRKLNTIVRLFQVPGPLHLEHFVFRKLDLLTADTSDIWIPSSRFIKNIYLKNKIPSNRLFLSYYGSDYTSFNTRSISNGERNGEAKKEITIGNVCYIYPPKYFLFQTKGLKNHEAMIQAVGKSIKKLNRLNALFIGGQWGNSNSYELKLRKFASSISSKIKMTGSVSPDQAHNAWASLDIAIHLPFSENCGGVIEPLLIELPVIASRVGGLPEVIIDGVTGYLVNSSDHDEVSKTIDFVYNNMNTAKQTALNGKRLVQHMFDINRTANEIKSIYSIVTKNTKQNYVEFSSEKYMESLNENV